MRRHALWIVLTLMSSSGMAQQNRWFPTTPPPNGGQLYPGIVNRPPLYRGGIYSPDVYAPQRNGKPYYQPGDSRAEDAHGSANPYRDQHY